MAVAGMEDSSWTRSEPTSTGPKFGGPTVRQPTFDWGSTDRYAELRNFRLEVNNILQFYNISNTEKTAIITNCLGRQCLQFIETLKQTGQELCKTMDGLFDTLSKNYTHSKMK